LKRGSSPAKKGKKRELTPRRKKPVTYAGPEKKADKPNKAYQGQVKQKKKKKKICLGCKKSHRSREDQRKEKENSPGKRGGKGGVLLSKENFLRFKRQTKEGTSRDPTAEEAGKKRKKKANGGRRQRGRLSRTAST